MKKYRISFALVAGASLALAPPPAAAAGMAVFDTANYAQSLLQAARALEQINHQIESLQNEATMVQAMARNLERIDFPQLERIRSAMQRIDGLMSQAQAIDFRIDHLDQQARALFPGSSARALSRAQLVEQARARLDAAVASYRQAMTMQAQIAENVDEDSGLLGELVGRSQGATGALQAQQASSQLLALGVKQQLQLQNLLAAEFRSQAIDRARQAQAESDGREATRRFLGAGNSYTRQRD